MCQDSPQATATARGATNGAQRRPGIALRELAPVRVVEVEEGKRVAAEVRLRGQMRCVQESLGRGGSGSREHPLHCSGPRTSTPTSRV